ncbi:MAG: AAA family ATPase [Ilumatobacteraceae bacterium]
MPMYGRPATTVGRRVERDFLVAALASASNRKGTAILIEGEPGMGKSHLLRDLMLRARDADVAVAQIVGHLSDSFEPYVSLSQLPRLSASPAERPAAEANDPRTRFADFNDYLSQLAQRPALFIVDDMQWLDESTLNLISRSIEHMLSLGLGFIGAVRTGAAADNGSVSHALRTISRSCTSVRLDGLDTSETVELARTVKGADFDEGFIERIRGLAGGNPLFTLEYLRLSKRAEPAAPMFTPPEVSRVIEERIRTVPVDPRTLVCLALLGGVGTIDDLIMVSESFGRTPRETRECVSTAEAAMLINRSHSRTVEFVHPLYATCLSEFPEAHSPDIRRSAMNFLERSGRHAEAFELCDETFIRDQPDEVGRLARAIVEDVWREDHPIAARRAADFVLESRGLETPEWVHAALVSARQFLAEGRREQGWQLARSAAEAAQMLQLPEEQATALLLMATLAEFVPDTASYTKLLGELHLDDVPHDLRVRLLATSSQVILSTPTAVTNALRPLGDAFRAAGFEFTESSAHSAWAWSTNATAARELADRALELSDNVETSVATRVHVLNSWREVHRSPAFLARRLRVGERAADISHAAAAVESRLLRSIDLYESGAYQLSVSELIVAGEAAKRYGDTWGQWRVTLRWAAHALSAGDIDKAWELSGKALAFGESAGEPGRIPALAAQQCAAAIERVFPHDQLWVFSIDPALTAHGPSRALAALACASAGDVQRASDYLEDSFGVFDDSDRESSWMLTLTTLIEVAAALGHTQFAARAVTALEPFADLNVVDGLGTLMRGPAVRYLGLARRTVGDLERAIDDLLRAKMMAQQNGEELWRLAALVDIAETLAPSGSPRLAQLVRMSDIDDAYQSQLTWRAERGRHALETAGRLTKENLTLSDRQITILREMAGGATIADIGQKLRFSHSTVRQESMAIYRLLGVDGRAGAIQAARDRFLI